MRNQLHPGEALKLDVVADLSFIVVVVGGGGVIPRKLAALLKEGSDARAHERRAPIVGEEGRGPSRAAATRGQRQGWAMWVRWSLHHSCLFSGVIHKEYLHQKGGGGSWKSIQSKGGCVNFIA